MSRCGWVRSDEEISYQLRGKLGKSRDEDVDDIVPGTQVATSQIDLRALCCKNSSAARGRLQRLAAHDIFHGGRRAEKGCR